MYEYEGAFNSGYLTCDCCDKEQNFDGNYFSCLDEAKSYDWKILKLKDDWLQFCCEDCKIKYLARL